MPDWKAEIKQRLARLALEPTREAYAELKSDRANFLFHCACRQNAKSKTCRMCAVRV